MRQRVTDWMSPKSRLFRNKHLWSIYLVIACLAGVVLGVLSMFSNATVKSLAETNASFAKSMLSSNSVAEDVLLNYATQIFYSAEVQKLRSAGELTNFEEIEGVRALNSYCSVCTFVETVYIYNKERDYIYSTSDHKTISNSSEAFADREAVDILLNPRGTARLVPIFRTTKYASASNTPYVYSYVLSDSRGAMMINISAEWFNSLLFTTDTPSCVINVDGDILSRETRYKTAVYEEAVSSIQSALSEKTDGYQVYESTVDGGKREQICFYAYMANRGWYILRIMDYEECMGSLLRIQRGVLEFFFLLILVGIIEAVILFVRVVFPFKRISTVLDSAGLVDEPDVSTEQLVEKLNALIASSRDTAHIQDTLSKVVRNEAIYSFLLGTEDKYEEAVEKYQIRLTARKSVLPVYINNANLESHLAVLREIGIEGDGVVVQSTYSVLLLQPADEKEASLLAEKLAAENPRDWVVTGHMISDWHKLPEEYARLREAFDRRFLYPDTHILSVECLAGLSSSIADLKEISKNLTAALKNGNAAQCRSLIDAFFADLPGKTLSAANASVTSMFQDIVHLYYELNANAPDDYLQTVDTFSQFVCQSNSINEIREQLTYAAAEIISFQKAKKATHQKDLMKEVMDIIRTEYADPNLSSQSLADRFSISCVYLNRIFKQYYGKSILASINEVRIENACTLLRETDRIIREVSEKCGFENSQHFYTLFKAKMSVTPTEYRKSNL